MGFFKVSAGLWAPVSFWKIRYVVLKFKMSGFEARDEQGMLLFSSQVVTGKLSISTSMVTGWGWQAEAKTQTGGPQTLWADTCTYMDLLSYEKTAQTFGPAKIWNLEITHGIEVAEGCHVGRCAQLDDLLESWPAWDGRSPGWDCSAVWEGNWCLVSCSYSTTALSWSLARGGW